MTIARTHWPHMISTGARDMIIASLLTAAWLAAYLPDVGHGFVKDDFAWIHDSRVRNLDDAVSLLVEDNGFFRPLVSLSFSLNELLFGMWIPGYAATNLLLLFLCAGALVALARALGLGGGTALAAAAFWVFNPHGIDGLALWISGRTSSLATLFSLMTAVAFIKDRTLLASASFLLALFAKEEPLLLPGVLAVWAGMESGPFRARATRAIRRVWPLFFPIALYLVLRTRTRAYLPFDAPSYYRFTFDPGLLLRNVLEYADRACTLSAAAVLLLLAAVRRRPRPTSTDRRALALAGAWLVLGFGLTVFIPSRSSLYACFPSVGAALAGAILAGSILRQSGTRFRMTMVGAACLIPFMLNPVYRSRHVRSARAAILSTSALRQLTHLLSDESACRIILSDACDTRPNLNEAFGSLLEPALRLMSGRPARVSYEPSRARWREALIEIPHRDCPRSLCLELRDGRIVHKAAGDDDNSPDPSGLNP